MAYQSKFMREQFGEEDQKSVPQFQSRFMQQLAAQPYRTRGALPTQTREQANAYRDLLKSKGRESVLAPYRGTAGDSAPNNWKGFGVNDPDKGDWSEFGDKSPTDIVELITAQNGGAPAKESKESAGQEISRQWNAQQALTFSSDPDTFSNQEYGQIVGAFLKDKAAETAFAENKSKVAYLGEKALGGAATATEGVYNNAIDLSRAGVNADLMNGYVTDTGLNLRDTQNFWASLFGGAYKQQAQDTQAADKAVAEQLPAATEQLRSSKAAEYAQGINERYGAKGLWALGGDIASGVGQMLPTIGVNAVTGGGAGMAWLMSSAAGNAAAEARAGGADEDTALVYGLLSGGVEVATEHLSAGIPGLNKTGLLDKVLGRVAGSAAGRSAVKKIVDVLGEGAEEYISEIAGAYLSKMWNGDDRGAWQTLMESQPDALYAGIVGALTSAVMNLPGAVKDDLAGHTVDKAADAARGGQRLTTEQIGKANKAAQRLDAVGSEAWYDVNMSKYADGLFGSNSSTPIATGTEATVPSMADKFTMDGKKPVQGEIDVLLDAFSSKTLTNAQIETLKPGGKNRAAFEEAVGMTLPETASKTRALLKFGAEESIDGTLKTEYNGVSGGVQNEPTGAERVSGVFENTMPVGPGMGSGHGQPGELAGGNQVLYRVLNNDRTTSDALTRVGSAYTDLHDTTAQPQVFTAALDDAIKANKHGLMVSSKTPQELADSGAVTFMTNDGLAGAAVTADGDIEAVFKNPASQIKRASAPLMLNAIENGGRKLDCYGIDLVQNYNKFGFEPVARVAWNPEYAPDGWTYGPKDVYVMKLADGLDADGVKARLGFSESDGGFHKWTQPELDALPEMDYDAALDYRDSLLKQNARPTSTGTSNASTNIYDAGLTWPNALFPDVYTENTDMVGQQLPWENTVGAKQSEFPGKQGVSRVASNTYENTPLFTQAEKNAANLNAANSQYQYDIISEKQSLKEAAQRVAVDKAGEMAELPTKEQFNGTDTDTAMLILQDEMKTAQDTGDYSAVSRWAKMIQEKGTEAGQRIQAFAKYTRTPEGTVVKGEGYLKTKREVWENQHPKQAKNIRDFADNLERAAGEAQKHTTVDAFENDLSRMMDEDAFGRATDAAARAERLISETAKKYDIKIKPDAVTKLAQQIVDGRLNASDAIDMLVEMESGIGRLEDADFKQIYDLMTQAMQYGENSRQRVDLEKQAYKVVADKTSATFMDKWDAWRYLAMLGNPKTHLRNTGGNGMFGEVVGVKDRIAGAIENALVRAGVDIDRTHSNLTPGDSQLVKASTADADEVYRILTGDGKYNPSRGIKEQQTVFKNKALETVRAWNNSALEAEDWFFLKQNYGRALAGYLKANGKDASVLSSNLDADVSFVDKARAYAINEAQKSTFRDFSQFASNLSQVSQNLRDSGKVSGKIASMAIEGLVPFKKTPVNVLKRGVEYSPVSLATGLYDALVEVPKGRSTASQAIDKISAGLTGTGIMTLGAFLMSQGLLTVGPSGDDKEDDFKELQGVQNYALSIGGKSYTIDWAAPAALPLFVGAEIYDFYYGENSMDTSTFNKISTGLSRIGEPVLEMTMLQGLNDAIESTQYNDGDPLISLFTTAATSYATQGVPTLAGQIARSVDPIRRTSAADETGAAGSMERLFNRMENKIPGLSQTNQPYIDQWGRTQENVGGNFAGRLAYNMLSPGFYSENKPTQVDDWLSQLYERTGEKSVLPGSATRTVTIDGESRRLTGDEYTAYAQTRGQTAFDILEVLVPGYKDLTDEQAVHATEKAYTVAQEIAKQEALGIEPSKEVQNNIERAESWGDGDWMAGIADILKANALTYDVKGDLIPGAKDKYYDGSRKRNCIAALVDAGYSQQQAMQLYNLLNN